MPPGALGVSQFAHIYIIEGEDGRGAKTVDAVGNGDERDEAREIDGMTAIEQRAGHEEEHHGPAAATLVGVQVYRHIEHPHQGEHHGDKHRQQYHYLAQHIFARKYGKNFYTTKITQKTEYQNATIHKMHIWETFLQI